MLFYTKIYRLITGAYGHCIEMPVHGINETLSVFVPIYTIYPYKAGGEYAFHSSM